jgi:3-phytase
MMLAIRLAVVCASFLASAGCNQVASLARPGEAITPVRETDKVPNDPDDPAIWIHPTDSSRSLILGTDKFERTGGLYVFGLDGRLRQAITPLDRPNNVDVEYGVMLGGVATDIAVVTERRQHRLRVYRIPPDGGAFSDLAPEGLPVLQGEVGDRAQPMGIALYKRPRDGAVYAIVAPKSGGPTEYLWQYRLEDNGRGSLGANLVRRFGHFSQKGAEPGEIGEIEAVVVDDALGYVYYSDERHAIRKYPADPDGEDAARELAAFGLDGYQGDREGLAIYETGDRTGYLVSSDQVPGATRVRLYRREGAPGQPHNHSEVRTVLTASDSTDGLDVTSKAVPGFPRGFLVMMNSSARNFLIYDWERLNR